MISLACATGIPPSVWAEEGEQTIITAIEIMNERNRKGELPGGPQMRG